MKHFRILWTGLFLLCAALACCADDVVPVELPPGESAVETSGTFGITPIDPSSMSDQVLTGTMTIPASIPTKAITGLTSSPRNKPRTEHMK